MVTPSHDGVTVETDEAGNTQPLERPWNTGGYANNAVQRVRVTVRAGTGG